MPKKIYGDTEGPLGLPMRDDVASEVEGILKALPEDCRELVADGPMRVAKGARVAEDMDPRTEVAFVTTDAVDRDNEVVLARGGDWAHWRKNPVVTWAHMYDMLPLGRGHWIKAAQKDDRDGLLAKTEYRDKPEEWPSIWFPDAVWHYVRHGDLPGRSIGFIPQEVRPPLEKEIRNRPELAGVSRVVAKYLGLEYAVCPVQSNPEALLELSAKGLKMPTHLDSYGIILPDPPATLEEMREVIEIKVGPEGETEASGDAETEPEPKAEEYECECIECGHKIKSTDHCKDVPCPKCGGTMRRAERPGPGQPSGDGVPPKAVEPEPELEKTLGRLVANPDDPKAARFRTPDEVAEQTKRAALQGMSDIDVDAIVDDVVNRIRGRIE